MKYKFNQKPSYSEYLKSPSQLMEKIHIYKSQLKQKIPG